jgi:hypothetical protein
LGRAGHGNSAPDEWSQFSVDLLKRPEECSSRLAAPIRQCRAMVNQRQISCDVQHWKEKQDSGDDRGRAGHWLHQRFQGRHALGPGRSATAALRITDPQSFVIHFNFAISRSELRDNGMQAIFSNAQAPTIQAPGDSQASQP